ncbi:MULTISPECIES: RNA polymerase sigma factor SigB [Bacillales]|uniref:RNA polymerase sigma factor n=1 Tax=Lysinibacillus louembei TaxID=1470088 RepID=A0ABZ0RZ97_9BACI|nr:MULTISPECIES: RNA polymerase sigma factor SigB [Bacillales]MCT6925495.1 RNA polymerase sigma factor SigB [Metasolibacillus sp.]MCT6941703.1 RNA polymerase sigma factor SigB [Metasolibacillus sp.]WPK13558.1 RNA polymerase sigma factor SigB [Lysinibacillus louembei]
MTRESLPNETSKEEILHWVAQYQTTKDETAQTQLVLHYQQLVEALARKYAAGKSYYEDIVQVGMLGLLGAIQRFDTTVGRSFEAFAIPTIIGEMKRYLRDKTWDVHVPRRIKELGPRIKATVEHLTIELQRSPTIPEIAAHLEVQEEEVLEAMELGRGYQALSMDHAIESDADGSTVTLFDVVGAEDTEFETADRRLIVSEIMHVLNEREQRVIELTYLKQLSQKETGDQLGISQMHVSRIQRTAIKKLQEAAVTVNNS